MPVVMARNRIECNLEEAVSDDNWWREHLAANRFALGASDPVDYWTAGLVAAGSACGALLGWTVLPKARKPTRLLAATVGAVSTAASLLRAATGSWRPWSRRAVGSI